MSHANPWPSYVTRSTGQESQTLLYALLATQKFDEISNAEDFSAVQRHIIAQGKASADESGILRTRFGVVFWVYPTGLYGPFRNTEEGEIKEHGLLLTVEPGASVEEAVTRAREALQEGIIVQEHVSA
ncbi:hypothetical protein D9758_011995 [Tetrapyrgos nigripes]|uniref:Uncharacterized protein n=1 Tax=Tetrapyrgos nigripes TaxID=182062 RepID=A0A8H5FQ66_9AGAR|nr:hypothetical protein D9758_011995 [Tetrapyrgos nigripes]